MVSQNSINNLVEDNDFNVKRDSAGVTVQSVAIHTDDTSATSNSKFLSKTGGTSGGDPHIQFAVGDTNSYSVGIDNSDNDNLKITKGADPSTGGIYITCDETTTNVWFSGISFDSGTNVMANYIDKTDFTPILEFGGATTGITYNVQTGKSFRVGNLVYIRLEIRLSSKGSATGNASITGIPITATSSSEFACRWGSIDFAANFTSVDPVIMASGTTIDIQSSGDNIAFVNLTDVEFDNASTLFLSGTYLA